MSVFSAMLRLIASLKGEKKDASLEKFERMQSGHIPGTLHRHSDGTLYRVQSDGAWSRETGKHGRKVKK